MVVETGLDGSVWTVLAGKWNPGLNRDHPDGFRDPKPAKTPKSVRFLPDPKIFFLVRTGHQEEIVDQSGKACKPALCSKAAKSGGQPGTRN